MNNKAKLHCVAVPPFLSHFLRYGTTRGITVTFIYLQTGVRMTAHITTVIILDLSTLQYRIFIIAITFVL
jgi:hypothetical protein